MVVPACVGSVSPWGSRGWGAQGKATGHNPAQSRVCVCQPLASGASMQVTRVPDLVLTPSPKQAGAGVFGQVCWSAFCGSRPDPKIKYLVSRADGLEMQILLLCFQQAAKFGSPGALRSLLR